MRKQKFVKVGAYLGYGNGVYKVLFKRQGLYHLTDPNENKTIQVRIDDTYTDVETVVASIRASNPEYLTQDQLPGSVAHECLVRN